MSMFGFGVSSKCHAPLHTPLFRSLCKFRPTSIGVREAIIESDTMVNDKINSPLLGRAMPVDNCDSKRLNWKKFCSNDLGITTSMISKPARKVLNGLKKKGYEVYLVGGCVRDLTLNRTPKDFDLITSAELKEVSRTFKRCEIVGWRFPICHVHIDGTIVEVSSFSTSSRSIGRPLNCAIEKPPNCEEEDYIRWKNCMQRDFTINSLMFDPYESTVYDYFGGMEDIRKAKVRTVIPACTSFQEDCARMLRGIRIAARLRFRLSKDTAHFIKHLSCLVSRLDKGRLLMEMNYMLSYGSAEASLRLLWKFGLLEILLPIQAAYFIHSGFRRRDKRSNMLLSLLSSLDKLLAPDRPCHCSLWVATLAFHTALSDQPRDPSVVAAFSLAVHNGGNVMEAIRIARSINRTHDGSFYELLKSENLDVQALIDEVMDLANSVKATLNKMTDGHFVSQVLKMHPQAPRSDLVFIPLTVYLKACEIFACVAKSAEKGFVPKRGGKIDYESLALGSLRELRHVFARIVFDTVYPFNLNHTHA